MGTTINTTGVTLYFCNQDKLIVSTDGGLDIKNSKRISNDDHKIDEKDQIRNTASRNGKAAELSASDNSLSPESNDEVDKCEIKKDVDECNFDSRDLEKEDKKIADDTPTKSDAESVKLADAVLPEKIEDKVAQQQNKRLSTLSEFFSNFDIPDKGFWNADFLNETETVGLLVQQYTNYKSRIKIAYANADNKTYFDGYSGYHTHRYLLETLVGEGNINGSTSLEELEKYVKEPDDTKTSLKINNLKNSMNNLFPDIFKFVNCESKINFENFTPEFIQDLHKQVMVNLVDAPGAFRTNWAAPSQENWMFLVPEKIPGNLDRLCRDLRKELEDELEKDLDEESLVRRVKIVANFLTQFLQIHPFKNGNGRVGRLLISWLMTDLSVVPVPLLITFPTRNTYLECLRDSRLRSPFVPANLARFILESVIKTIRIVCVSLDI